MEEGGYDNNGFDEGGGAAGGRGDEDENYEFPEEGRYKYREEKYTYEEMYHKIFENKDGNTVGKERYKDSFVIKYNKKEFDFGQKARVASAKLFHERYPNMDTHAARDAGDIMFGFRKDGTPVVKIFEFDEKKRNHPYVIDSKEFPQEIKNILEPGEEEETETISLLPSPEKTTGRNVWEEEDGVKINISEDASREVSVFLEGIYNRIDHKRITLGINEYDRYVVKILGKGNIFYKIDRTNGDVEDRSPSLKVPKTIKDAFGKKLSVESMRLSVLGKSKETEIQKLSVEKERATTSAEVRNFLEERIEELEEEVESIQAEREAVEEKMSLKERVKLIFKKHGFTVVAVLTAIGTVIGVLLSNLKAGLAKVAKGVGNGLKELGAKLAGILPGMIGAIAKFLFDTAGEVIGFLAEHTWLLIVGLVALMIESFKGKYAKKKK